MYIVRDRETERIVHVNPAPLEQELAGKQIYVDFEPETMEIGKTYGPLPEHFKITDAGEIVELTLQEKADAGIIVLEPHEKISGTRIVDKSLSEKVADGLIEISPTQKIVDDEGGERVISKTTQELIDEGLLTREEANDRSVKRLRQEVDIYFNERQTPNGYPLDNLARQKASFSSQFRSLRDDDPTKKPLLDAGLIYPDEILDEILAEVAKVQAAYSAAKKAVGTACEGGEPVETWESISIHDFFPEEEAPAALFTWARP